MAKTLLILGATGLVGQQCLQQALAHPDVARVVAPTRRPLAAHPKLENPVIDFAAMPSEAPWWRADAMICALGTTLKLAGSPEAFRQVDYGYVMQAARLAKQAGTPGLALNSSLGAGVKASSFYLRVKGEVERDVQTLGFSWLALLRPSLLDGGPRPDSRPGERFALALCRLLGPLVPRRLRPVSTVAVARVLLQMSLRPVPGVIAVESAEIGEHGSG